MSFLLKRNNRYYYNRRVPETLSDIDDREYVRVSLKTDSQEIAKYRCAIVNQEVENYWQKLIDNGESHSNVHFQNVIKLARLMGFRYVPQKQLAESENLNGLLHRLNVIQTHNYNESVSEAVLGGVSETNLTVSEALEKFWIYSKDRIINKSEIQLRKWKNPRKKAINNFIKVVGNIALQELNREHILQFRDWWIDRIENDTLSESSANKDFIHFKNIIETVNDNSGLGLNTIALFQKITLKEKFKQNRLPFDTDYIKDTLLNSKNLKDLNKEAKYFLYAMADTGARVAELTGLETDDIILHHQIPHIRIRNKKNRLLKTPHSERDIPLVGSALIAFQNCPEGFPQYRDKTDTLSTYLNKHLREKKLFPSDNHSVYSLRHSFQDRLLKANAPDRVQADLMGHKFKRPLYGSGASLEQKKEWLEKIRL